MRRAMGTTASKATMARSAPNATRSPREAGVHSMMRCRCCFSAAKEIGEPLLVDFVLPEKFTHVDRQDFQGSRGRESGRRRNVFSRREITLRGRQLLAFAGKHKVDEGARRRRVARVAHDGGRFGDDGNAIAWKDEV